MTKKQIIQSKLEYACSGVVLLGLSIEDALKDVNLPVSFSKTIEKMLNKKGFY